MKKNELPIALSLVGTTGILASFMPGSDKLWAGSSDDPELQHRVRMAMLVFGTVAAVVIIAAMSQGYYEASFLALLIYGAAIFYYCYAFRTSPGTLKAVTVESEQSA